MKKMMAELYIDSLYTPSEEFDYEGCIEVVLHGINFGMRVLPVYGTWDVWSSGQQVKVNLFFCKRGPVKKCEPYIPARFQRFGLWSYRVEGKVAESDPDLNLPHSLVGFPEIEIDQEVIQEGSDFIQDVNGLSFMADLWAELD